LDLLKEDLEADACALGAAAGVTLFDAPAEERGRERSKLIPYALTPHPFPKKMYVELRSEQGLWNCLMDAVACSGEHFLYPASERTAESDEVVKNLLRISRKVYGGESRPYRNEPRAMICRNDFMLDAKSKRALQIEMNVIQGARNSQCCPSQGSFKCVRNISDTL
jgi:hypothetical protein